MPTPQSLWADAIRPYGSKSPLMSALRGDSGSRWVLLGPPPSSGDYSNGLPFSDASAGHFHEGLLKMSGWDTQLHFIVVPVSLYGTKPCTASTAPVVSFLKTLAVKFSIKGIAVVGRLAYKFTLGEGRAAPETVFRGMVRSPFFNYIPAYTFQEPSLAYVQAPDKSSATRDELNLYRQSFKNRLFLEQQYKDFGSLRRKISGEVK